MSTSTVDYPFYTGQVRMPSEDRVYDVKVFQPHIFTLAVNQYYPQFSNRYAVNIGAGDGISFHDPVYPLYQLGFGGLAVEGENNLELAQNLPSDAIHKVVGEFVTPMNVADLFARHACPQCPDFLKLDIDGYDGPILLEILKAGYRPKVMQIEINPEIPPPIEFAVLYDARYRVLDDEEKVGGFYGASFSYVCNLAARYGYRPAQLDVVTGWCHDVTLVYEEYWPIACKLIGATQSAMSHRELFLHHPPGHSHFAEYGIDTRDWRYREDYHVLAGDIWLMCGRAGQKKHGKPMPFHLTVS